MRVKRPTSARCHAAATAKPSSSSVKDMPEDGNERVRPGTGAQDDIYSLAEGSLQLGKADPDWRGDHVPESRREGPEDKPDRMMNRRLILYGLAGAVFVLASLCIKLYEVVPHPHDPDEAAASWLLELSCIFLLEIGIGVIVACVLARTLESYLHRQSELQHRRQIRRIQQHTLEALFGIHVERKFYDELANLIFRYKLRRNDFTIVYQFEPAVDGTNTVGSDDKLKVTVTVSYTLRNIARRHLDHPLRHYFEMLLPGCDDQDYKRFSIKGCMVEGEEEQVVWIGEELQKRLRTEGIRRVFNTRIRVAPKKDAQVEFTYSMLKRAADTDIWLSTVPAKSLRIIAVIDRKLYNLQFWPDAVHWDSPILVRHVPEGRLRTYEWCINSIILPNQGIILLWRPDNPAPAPTAGEQQCAEKKGIVAG